MEISTLQSKEDSQQLLALQAANLGTHLSPEEAKEQGFLTVQHHIELLEKMRALEPQVVIKEEGQIVAYVLAMPRSMRNDIPILIPFFDQLDLIQFQGLPLKDTSYILNGQVCVDKSHRGKGTFDLLFQGMKSYLSDRYNYVVTEIAQRNTRSLRAHSRVGFQTIDTYTSPEGEDWAVVLWDWK